MKYRDKDNWFDIQLLADNLYGIGEFGHLEEVLSFLLIGERQAVLMDTGLGLYDMRAQVEALTDLPVVVVNSHSHFDHVGSNAAFDFVAAFDHPDNREMALRGASAEYLQKWSTDAMFWGKKRSPMPDPYEILPYPDCTYFGDGTLIDVAPFQLEVLHTPGHSDDSISLYEPNQGWLFAFDLLYDGPIYIEPIGGLAKYRQSLARVAALPKLARIFGSHNAYEFSLAHFQQLKAVVDELDSAELTETISIDDRLRLELA